jgi:pterin-4a-carbinolamine dehydratase
MSPPSERQAALEREAQRGWRRRGERLVCELSFRDFDEALEFFARLANGAADYGRRPDMCIAHFNRVRLEIANPHHAGLTLAEFRLAAKVNAIVETHHPTAVSH